MAETIPRRPTIQDVARIAGVSPMTVSRVVNGHPSVKAETRDAVNGAIAKLDYVPNPAARSLVGAGAIRIGLLYGNPSLAYLSAFLMGSLEKASQAHAQLVVERCETGLAALDTVRQILSGNAVDGLLLPPPLCDDPLILDLVEQEGVPTVAIASGAARPTVASISIDDYDAALVMTRHIIGLGHRRISFIVGNPDQIASARRLEGFKTAMAEAGITVEDSLVAQGLFTYRSGLDAAEQLLDQKRRPTAIFASNDDMAAATVAVAHRNGLDVPGDLTVCGFDDTALATTIWPELTTIHQPIAMMACEGIGLLIETIRRRSSGNVATPVQKRVAFSLIRRQSDAPPRRRPREDAP